MEESRPGKSGIRLYSVNLSLRRQCGIERAILKSNYRIILPKDIQLLYARNEDQGNVSFFEGTICHGGVTKCS